jgi:hypothetical protein
LGHRGAAGKPALVEQRALRGDGDRLLDGRGEAQGHRGVAPDAHLDARVLDRPEALEIGLERVQTRVEAQEPELPLGVGDLGLVGAYARQRHRDAG